MTVAYYIQIPIKFPEGVHFGTGKHFNLLAIANDGLGRPVLNGTSLAGWLRNVWRQHLPAARTLDRRDDPTNVLFGSAIDDTEAAAEGLIDTSVESSVKVTNYVLSTGGEDFVERTHHYRNRHRGTVLEGGLFGVEMCPPGTTTQLGIWILEPTSDAAIGSNEFDEQAVQLLNVASATLASGAWMGGSRNRGFGRVEVDGAIEALRFDLSKLSHHANYLAAHRQWRQTGQVRIERKTFDFPLNPKSVRSTERFTLQFTLTIPTGQDLLVADTSEDGIPEPQRVAAADSNTYWRIPGSSLRGLFRSWFHRLAARDSLNSQTQVAIADNAWDYVAREQSGSYTGDQIGIGWTPDPSALPEPSADFWPIVSLFGDLRNPGRIRISDAVSRCSDAVPENCLESQARMHVAVDRVTGGAAKGLLFRNRVLTTLASCPPTFRFHLQIDRPRPQEVQWLARALIALHLGILRVGSSKSAGRLQFTEVPQGRHLYADEFQKAIAPLNTLLQEDL